MTSRHHLTNPLLGVSVGSTVSGNDFKPSVLGGDISKMIPEKEIEKFMSGHSSYVYSDTLNEASIGMSGAYGVSGVSKLSSSLSTYGGNVSATASKSIDVNYNVSMISGIEYIDFDSLTAENMLNALTAGPKDLATDVLDKFNTLRDYQRQNNLTLFDHNMMMIQDARQDELVQEWLTGLKRFTNAYGDGIVVGIVWGGSGSVSMSMTSRNFEDNWKYGGNAEFTYAGTGASASVAGSYNGAQNTKDANVDVSCRAVSSGGCVAQQVDRWFETVSGKSFAEISGIKMLDQVPAMGSISPPPQIPPFIIPKNDPSITEKLEKIGQLGSTEELSVLSGCEKMKSEDSTITPEKYREKARQSNTLEKFNALAQTLKENRINVLADITSSNKHKPHIAKNTGMQVTPEDYAPLGVWILNWSEIFPWLSTGYLNEITDTAAAEDALRKRCMMQDFCSLSNIYYTFYTSKIWLDDLKIKAPLQIADSFSHALAELKNMLDEEDAISRAYELLGEDAQKIYRRWNDIGFLRNAELGLGLLANGNISVTNELLNTKPLPFPEAIYRGSHCIFSGSNHNAFSSFLKLLPLIDTDGQIYAFGPASMLLKNIFDEGGNSEVAFTKSALTAMAFTPDAQSKRLINGSTQLIPVPVSAANGTKWMGQGTGISLSSSTSLTEQFSALKDELSRLNICSLSSDSWMPDWEYTDPYHLRELKTSYIGIVSKLGNIFPE